MKFEIKLAHPAKLKFCTPKNQNPTITKKQIFKAILLLESGPNNFPCFLINLCYFLSVIGFLFKHGNTLYGKRR